MADRRLVIGSGETTLGTVRLNEQTGEIEIVSALDRERLARLLASLYDPQYEDDAALYRSLPTRLNNGYMWAVEAAGESEEHTR